MVKKTKRTAAVIIGVVFLWGIGYFCFPQMPFSSLEAAQIQEVHLLFSPSGEKRILNPVETEEMVAVLQKLKTYPTLSAPTQSFDPSMKCMCILKDGTGLEIVASDKEFLAVNGEYFRTQAGILEDFDTFVHHL